MAKSFKKSPISTNENENDGFSFIFWLRLALTITLVSLIAGFGAGTYIKLKSNEVSIFTDAFQSIANQISAHISTSMENKKNTAHLARSMYRTAINTGALTAPNMTLPGYEEIMTTVLPFAKLRSIQFAPMVRTDQASSWEHYARTHVADLHGPASLTQRSSAADWLVADGIFQFGPDHIHTVKTPTTFPDSAYPHWLFPLWQVAPVADNAGVLMLEVHDQNRNHQLIDGLLQQTQRDPAAVHSGITEPFQLFQDGTAATNLRPSTVMYTPSAHPNGDIFGLLSFVFTWDDVFHNLLDSNTQLVYLVLTTKTSTYTFSLDGPKATVLGKGDLHDPAYSQYAIALSDESILGASGYTFTVYPSADMYHRYLTLSPLNTCALVVGLCVFSALFILFYSYMLQQRETALVYAATRDAALESKKQFVRYV
jgi:hypothetical protein